MPPVLAQVPAAVADVAGNYPKLKVEQAPELQLNRAVEGLRRPIIG
jgi:hypothetical protein